MGNRQGDHIMTLTLAPLTAEYAEQIRQWRNENLAPWRTPFYLTEEMQRDWYERVICDRNSNRRSWAVLEAGEFVAHASLVGIQWENRTAEIALNVRPDLRGQGLGAQVVELILEQAFDYLGLETVYGECYASNPAIDFWQRMADRYNAYTTVLPKRKYWAGEFWPSLWFSFNRADWQELKVEVEA